MESLIGLYLPLALAATLAGLVDAVVGGGGLIQVPALFSVLPQAAPATLFGTNKLAGICGTAMAARSYWRRYPVDWALVGPAAAMALVGAFAGAWAITVFPAGMLRKLLPFLLLLVAIYVFRRKHFGSVHAPTLTGRRKTFWALIIGATIGAYDGFLVLAPAAFSFSFLCGVLGWTSCVPRLRRRSSMWPAIFLPFAGSFLQDNRFGVSGY